MPIENLADAIQARDQLIAELRGQLAARNEEIDQLKAWQPSQARTRHYCNEKLLACRQSEERSGTFVTAVKDITENERVEQVLTEGEARINMAVAAERQRLYEVLEMLPAMVCLLTPDYQVAFANQAFREKFGVSHGRHCYETDGPCGFCQSLRVLETGKPHHWEAVAPNGRVIDVYDHPFTDVDGSPLILKMVLDITERKQAEEALRQSLLSVEAANAELRDSRLAALKLKRDADAARRLAEDTGARLALADWRMQQALLAGHSFTFDWDSTTDQVQRSNSCAPILGLAGEAATRDTGRNFYQRIHPEDRDRFMGIFQTLTPETANYSTELRVRRGDGSLIVLEETGKAEFDADGKLLRVFGVATDISRRKQAEAELRRSEARYRLLHESMRDGFVQVSMEGRITDCNEVYCRMLGYSTEEMRLLTYIQITPERWHDLEATIVRDQIMPRGYSDIYEKEYRRKDGSVFPVEFRTILIRDDDGLPAAMWAIVRDITERKKNEEELKALNDELERRVELRTQELQETQTRLLHVEKLSAIGKLSASIAHEFNSPLQTVMTVLKGLRLGGQLNGEERKLLEAAIGESERMKSLIRDLQDFYRPSSGRKILMNLHATLDSLLLLHKSDLNRRNIKIALHYEERLPHIMAIPDQIKQVLLNLLNNAADACLNQGGVITISTWTEGEKVAVAIRDTGVGIPPANMEQIFRPFFSTKAEVKGTGLGLSVSYGIVSNHHGEIRVESQPGQGATFTVLLPIREM